MSRQKKEFHLFYDVGDDEVQIDSYDKGMNETILELARAEPGSVWIGDSKDSPAYLRAAVRNENVEIRFKRNVSDKLRKVRSENGKRNAGNLKHNKQKAGD